MDIITKKLSNETFYAYHKGRFWRWDDARGIWKESHLMARKFERARSAVATLTPESFLGSAEFEQPDEYELDFAMVDALKDAKPCKTAPIEPVEEVPTPSAQCLDAATVAEKQTAVSPAVPEESIPTTETAHAAQNAAVLASAGEKNAALSAISDRSSDKPLTTIQDSIRPEFDYSGLTDQTVESLHFAEDEYRHGKKMAERGFVHMGNAIAAAHDALCGTVVQQLDNGKFAKKEDTFRAWCCSIGITKSTAYNLLQVSALMDGSSPRQRAVLESLPPTLLYAVAKPSAPPELVEQVKNGDISTNKEYQALLKENQQLRTDRVNAMNQVDRERDRAERALAEIDNQSKTIQSLLDRSEKADARADQAESHYKAALSDLDGLTEQNSQLRQSYNEANDDRISARLQCQKAEAERDKAETRAKEAEDALKKLPITAVIDEEEVDRRAAEKAWGLADARNAELAQDNASLKKELEALRSRINDDAQADFEQANYCASLMRAAWDNSKASYSRLTGEDLESTFQAICGTLRSIMEEASLLCRQPSDYDGGERDE